MTDYKKHYNLYIEPDEEITIIVDRLRNARARDIAVIVPQHALLLQSLVNLRLLSREAMKQKKAIVIVTQDEEGARFAERVGMRVVPLQEWQAHNQGDHAIGYDDHVTQGRDLQRHFDMPPKEGIFLEKRNDSFESEKSRHHEVSPAVQMSDFQAQQTPFEESLLIRPQGAYPQRQSSSRMDIAPGFSRESTLTRVPEEPLYTDEQNSVAKGMPAMDMHAPYDYTHESVPIKTIVSTDNMPHDRAHEYAQNIHPIADLSDDFEESQGSAFGRENSTQKQLRVAKKMKDAQFYTKPKKIKPTQDAHTTTPQKGPHAILFSRGAFIVAAGFTIMILSIFLLPFTKIVLQTEDIDAMTKVNVTASIEQESRDAERRLIPARIIKKNMTREVIFTPTGTSDTDAQKAQGTITIYNAHSAQPQPLVARTRFLSEDGTLFRIVKATIVPGMKKQDGEEVPGSVETLAVADVAGGSGNIGATRFTIPGFKGTGKYNNFYAEATHAMEGGGDAGAGQNSVTETDIANAKETAEKNLTEYVMTELKDLLRPDAEVLLSDIVQTEIVRSESTSAIGTTTDEAIYTVMIHVTAMVFLQEDIIAIAQQSLHEQDGQFDFEQGNVNIDYGSSTVDFAEEKMMITFNAKGILPVSVNVKDFMRDIRGHKLDEISTIIKNEYPSVTDAIVTTYPSFPHFIAGHISRVPFMTRVRLSE